MKKIKLIINALILLLLFIGCKRKESNNTANIETKDTATISKRIDSVLVNYLTIPNIKRQLAEIPDVKADEYFNLYIKEFRPSLTNKGKYPFFYKIHGNVVNDILIMNGNNPFHFILTSNNKKLDLLYKSPTGERYIISEVSKLTKVEQIDFIPMDSAFQQNFYREMNDIKKKLIKADPNNEGDNSFENTTDIIIPLEKFKKYNPNDGDSGLTILPGIINENIKNENGLSKKYHYTIIMAIYSIDSPIPTVYYDDFCLKPPGC